MSTCQLLHICKPCTVLVEKLPDTVFAGLRYENAKERAKVNRWRKVAMSVTQKSARRRGRARRFRRSIKGRNQGAPPTPQIERSLPSCHLFTAFSEMLAGLCPGGDTTFLLTENESLIVSSLLDVPNVVRAKIIEMAARSSVWSRVSPQEIDSDWLERLVDSGIISVAFDLPDEYSAVLHVLSVPELKTMCKRAGLATNFPKPVLIRELSVARQLDEEVLKSSPESNEIYDLRRIVRVEEPVRELILKTAHLFVLPLSRTDCFRVQSSPIYKLLRPCLPLNPSLKSIKFDGYSEIFKNREEFSRWAQAKADKCTLERSIALKKFKLVEKLVLEVASCQRIPVDMSVSSDNRPDVLRQFSGKFVDVQTLSLGVEALISSDTNLQLAEEIVRLLLKQLDRSVEEKCSWYYLLASIFEKRSSPEKSADMARLAAKRACGHCESCRSKLVSLMKRISYAEPQEFTVSCDEMTASKEVRPQFPIVVIKRKSASQGFQGLKRVYSVVENGAKLHLSVEELVMHHFFKDGYPKGLDDEGRTLRNLCYLAVWEETYATDVPYVFCARWQAVPLDWGTPKFWITRKNQLKEKIQKLSRMQPEEIALHLTEKRSAIGEVAGTVEWSVVRDFDPKGILSSLTAPLFGAICTRLLCVGKRGFPDLVLWNEEEKKCVFVEVKGPNDRLTSSQQDWLEFINNSQGHAMVAEVRE